ncbi:MAG: S8/S53 family peptidase [Bacteroidota bacterium]
MVQVTRYNVVLFVAALLGTSLLFAGNTQQSENQKPETIPGVLYVKLKSAAGDAPVTTAMAPVMQNYQVRTITSLFQANAKKIDERFTRWYKVTFPEYYDVQNAAKDFNNDPSVEYAEPSYIYHTDTTVVPNDPFYSSMYNLKKVLAEEAWGISMGDTSVVIGICDSGMDYSHEDLEGNLYYNAGEMGLDNLSKDKRSNGVDDDQNGFIDDWRGWDFVGPTNTTFTQDNDPHPYGGNPHGTHVAGTASATTNNGKGISGMGFKCRLLATKHGTDQAGSSSIYFGYEGLLYLIDNGANVINASWGGPSSWSKFGQDVILYGLKKNVLIVAAAGNGDANGVGVNNELTAHFPSNYTGVLAVGASDATDKKAGFSNYGRPNFVKVFAPGVSITSTIPSGYSSAYSGTSMASPLVAGLAGLIRAQHPSWSAGQVMLQIAGTADPIDAVNPTFAGKLGYGRINALRALTETIPQPTPEVNFVETAIRDSVGGNNNGIIEPGEKGAIRITLQNTWGDALNLTATLTIPSAYQWMVTVNTSVVNFGTLRGVANYDSSIRSNAAMPFEVTISPDGIPMNIPYTIALKADNGYSKEYTGNISISSKLLFVDDDDSKNNVEGYYYQALKKLNIVYDVWDHAQRGSPTAEILKNYNIVIWGCEWTFPALDSSDRTALAGYLDNGGKLFISGQDIGWDMCDVGGATIPNEYGYSNGASKLFYEKYLHAKYVADDGGSANIAGVPADSISNGLSFTRYQPGRKAGEQFGDVMDTLNGSQSVFIVNGGTSYKGRTTAVRYAGAYRLVHFGFGGFEAITDSNSRFIVMDRVVNWLNGLSVTSSPLTDNENTTVPYPVSVTVKGSDQVSATLYWSTTGQFPFTKIAMAASGNGAFTSSIPAQPLNTTVSYFILIKAGTQFLPFQITSFKISADTAAPQFAVADTIQHTIKRRGPYTIATVITDRSPLDTATIIVKYSVNGSAEQSVQMTATGNNNEYRGTIVPAADLNSGDVVSYYLAAADKSNAKNVGRYPAGRSLQFIIGKEMIDDFERPIHTPFIWSTGIWGRDNTVHQSGLYSFTDSPDGLYSPNSNNALQMKTSLDLTNHSSAQLSYYRKVYIDPSDTLYVECSSDSIHWSILRMHTGLDSPFEVMTRERVSLDNFTGAGNATVWIRFRMHADGSNENDGAYIDDVELLTGLFTSVHQNDDAGILTVFLLSQNYPNPFNPSTTIGFTLHQSGMTSLKVYDAIGREVATLANEYLESGVYHQRVFNASKLASGVYFTRLTSSGKTQMRKILLIK